KILEQTYMQHKLFLLAALVIAFAACNNDEPVVNNYYIDDNPAVVQGQLSGKFSVSPTKKVSFSQGNLQYNAAQDKWRFATNQYDFVGDAFNGNVIIGATACNNANISNDYNGWIDLFGWGTGDNPTCATSVSAHYKTFTDWGAHIIDNGGGKVNLWRTLTKDEWVYIFYGRKDAAKKFALGSVDGINGTILLPDNWSPIQGVSFSPSTSKGMEDLGEYYYDSNGGHFGDNPYTIEQWCRMDSAGAVFLPAAGYRSSTSVYSVGERGMYWSSTPSSVNYVYYVHFGSDHLSPQYEGSRIYGQSVRLVR
ncbi:MAG: hypothetical protein J6W92_04540, partial [Paludibacteraceae bacterium]|nr:hypothetical protein [Paludibacteraceae bacterium]